MPIPTQLVCCKLGRSMDASLSGPLHLDLGDAGRSSLDL